MSTSPSALPSTLSAATAPSYTSLDVSSVPPSTFASLVPSYGFVAVTVPLMVRGAFVIVPAGAVGPVMV